MQGETDCFKDTPVQTQSRQDAGCGRRMKTEEKFIRKWRSNS